MQNILNIKYEWPFDYFSTNSSPSDMHTDLSKQILLGKRNDSAHALAFQGAFQKRRLRNKLDWYLQDLLTVSRRKSNPR
jgi:hypothetical protein